MPVFHREIGGRDLIIETGKLARQADGAVTVRYGDTVVLVTACMSKRPREGIDFFPLTIDYEERLYAAGKIPGGFFRREGRPSQEATLTARLTDRPLRPLFPKGLHNEVQVIITVLSVDQENAPDILAVVGASAALSISSIPFEGPVGAVRVGYVNGKFVTNPTTAQLQESLLDVVVAGTRRQVVMVEAEAKEAPENLVVEAIRYGQQANQDMIGLQDELCQACARPSKEFAPLGKAKELETAMASLMERRLSQGIYGADKAEQEEFLETLRNELMESLGDSFSEATLLEAFDAKLKAETRRNILEKGIRPDGRGLTEIRPIRCEVGVLPRTHGSALFTRGDTQVLTITTLGSLAQRQTLDGLGPEESKRFMHHYNFPAFSNGEVKRIGSPGRREIGHGALAERAILPVIPPESESAYAIRLVSEVLSSSGSTSMASVCSSTLSLMDAGVPIKRPVAGIAMGLIAGESGNYAILTDIQGIEDAYGDMDFKVAGTSQGITALQMDTKLKGVDVEVLEKAVAQAREARLFILDKMQQVMAVSRSQPSPYAPRIYKIMIPPHKIGAVIGPGGRTIRSMTEETKTTIDVQNDGTVTIGSTSEEAARKAMRLIEGLTKEVEVGEVYTGKVTRLLGFGALVEILPGKEGMVHISELADYRVPSVEDVVKVGDEIIVKVIETDRLGKIRLSRRAVLEEASTAGTGAEKKEPGDDRTPGKRPFDQNQRPFGRPPRPESSRR